MYLQATKSFLNKFRKDAQGVNNRTGYWRFEKRIKGNFSTYISLLEILQLIDECFVWIAIEGMPVKHIDVNEYIYDEKVDYAALKDIFLKEGFIISIPELENPFDFYTNILVEVENGEEKKSKKFLPMTCVIILSI